MSASQHVRLQLVLSPPSRSRALTALLRPDALRWVGLGALIGLSSMLALAGPLVVRQIIDLAQSGATSAQLASLAFVYLAIAIAAQIITVVVSWFATVTAWRTTNELRIRMTRHVLGLDHEFHRRHTPGELIQRVDGDITSVSDFLGQVVPRLVGAATLVIGILGVLAVIDWRIAVGAAAYLALSVRVVMRGRHRAVDESSDEMSAYAVLYGGIEERLTAAEDLRANGASTHALWRFVGESAGTHASAMRRESAFMRLWWTVQGSVAIGSVLSLVVGAILVGNGAISLGTAFLMFQYMRLLERPLEDIVNQLETVQKANGAMVRVVDLLAIEPTIVDRGTTSPPDGALSIEFRGLTFGYGDDQPVLHDIDLTLAAGRSLGIVGRTGSGKSTLSRLALRLVEPLEGKVLLGGVAIAEIPMAELRRRVAMIPQEVELFSGTIRDNVTLFDDSPSDDAVAEALCRVGLDTLGSGDIHRRLGVGGTGLSAGEAQLLALARVWLRNPDLVVLDEATARVDPHTEALIERAIAELIAGRTALVIAHRLSTLRHVDEIAIIDRGRLVEHGSRAELAQDRDSRFRHLLDLALETTPDGVADAVPDVVPDATPETSLAARS